jgi:hypothetical protein
MTVPPNHPSVASADESPLPVPPLAEFLRWLAEMPDSFRAEPVGFRTGRVPAHAVAADLLETYLGEYPDESLVGAFRPTGTSNVELNRMRWILAECHLLWHPALRTRNVPAASLRKLLVQEVATLAALVPASALAEDDDRREELIRRTLRALGLGLPGESAKEAEDRLTQLDSVEHQRLIRAAKEKEKRAREVREMMARRAAEEAAAKVSRE